jgi:hypothetical protein
MNFYTGVKMELSFEFLTENCETIGELKKRISEAEDDN